MSRELITKIEKKNKNIRFHGLTMFDNQGRINPPVILYVFKDTDKKKFFAVEEHLLKDFDNEGSFINA